jgi:acyl-CoA synthetase (AMP-forming)/AMP-acid ligase II
MERAIERPPTPATTPANDTLIAAWHRAWQAPARGNTIALADDTSSLTYAELFDEVGRLAGRLHRAGVRPGDRLALAMERSTGLALAILATLAAGACPCPLEPNLGTEETQRRFSAAGIDCVLADAAHADDPSFATLAAHRRLSLDALPQATAPFWATDTEPGAAGFLLFTSGSTGKPKGVLQSHRGLMSNTLGVIAHTGLLPGDRLLHVMPLHHTNGVNNQLFAPLLAGSTVVLASRFRADEMPRLMARHRPTLVTGVPTMYARMLELDFPAEALAAVRMLRCGSAPITEELHRRIEAKFGRPLVISYGLSEATCTSTMNPPGARRIGSVGTVLAGQSVHLEGPQGRRIDGVEEDGEICISGPSLMLGYLDGTNPGVPVPPGDVLHTGDLGRFDADGYLRITGRIKDVIIRGGENLSPALIEGVLCEVPGVHACCVVGGPDADLGEVPVAFIVRQPGVPATDLDLKRLGDAVAAKLSRIHRPAAVHFVDALPENGVGKVDRKRLAASLRA